MMINATSTKRQAERLEGDAGVLQSERFRRGEGGGSRAVGDQAL